WKSTSPGASFLPVPLDVAAGGQAAAAKFPLREDGSLRLVLTGDHGLKSDFVVAVRATKDAPPAFEKVVGLADLALEVRPGEKVPVELVLTDDFAVTKAQFEYALGTPQAIPRIDSIHLDGTGTPQASAKAVFALGDKARDGETLYLRVR